MNNLNNTRIHDKNRGVELLLYRREGNPEEDTTKKFTLKKTISLFQKQFKFELKLWIIDHPKLSEK